MESCEQYDVQIYPPPIGLFLGNGEFCWSDALVEKLIGKLRCIRQL